MLETMNVENKLTMKQVVDEVESINRNAYGSHTAQQHSEEDGCEYSSQVIKK